MINMKKIKQLTNEDLIELRKQIVFNSIIVADYENEFEIDSMAVCIFFEQYFEYLSDLADEIIDENTSDIEALKIVFSYDNEENLLNYFNICEFI